MPDPAERCRRCVRYAVVARSDMADFYFTVYGREQRIAAVAVHRFRRVRQEHLRLAVERHVKSDRDILLRAQLPARRPSAGGGIIRHIRIVQSRVRFRRKNNLPESRHRRIASQSRRALSDPRHDGAVGVVVEAVHARRGHVTVRLQRIPPLPDRRRTQIDLVQPSRKLFVEQNLPCEIRIPRLRQDLTEHRRTDEACLQLVIAVQQQILQVIGNRLRPRRETKRQ